MPKEDVLVTLPPFLRMKSTSSFILIRITDGVNVDVGKPLGGLQSALFFLLLNMSGVLIIGSFKTTEIIIEVFRGGSLMEDVTSTKIFWWGVRCPGANCPQMQQKYLLQNSKCIG
jgi:hypothetical protein